MLKKTMTSLGYKDIFDDYKTVDIVELLNIIPTKNSFEIIGYFFVQIHNNRDNVNKQIELLNIWVERLPSNIKVKINKFIRDISKNSDAEFNFFNDISALILIQNLIKNENHLLQVQNLTVKQELNLFKVYLLATQEWLDKQIDSFKIDKLDCPEDLVKLFLPSQLPYFEVCLKKSLDSQIIKAIYFFKYCEQDIEFKNYLTLFLKEYNLKSWQHYLFNLIQLFSRQFKPLSNASIVTVSDNFSDIKGFLKGLSIDTKNFVHSSDFLGIREKPIYRVNTDDFTFLSLNFFIDKIYQGIQFNFSKVILKQNATFKGKTIKTIPDFMSIFGTQFSEPDLFYKVMEYAFEKSNYKRYSGNYIKSVIHSGEPDYYIRDKSKVYIFEFKNVYINSEVKHSYNFEIIKGEFLKKFSSNQNGSAKGLVQIINSIEKLENKEFNKFDDYDFSNAIIYPIIVYVDLSLNIIGPNYLLNNEFKKKLKENKNIKSNNIKDLIIVDIDTFIIHQDLFRNKTIKLNNCFNEYYEYLKNKKDIFNAIAPFNSFLNTKVKKYKQSTPKIVIKEIINLYNQVIEKGGSS